MAHNVEPDTLPFVNLIYSYTLVLADEIRHLLSPISKVSLIPFHI
nr:MAG TPA: hypothetical protein [Bacteriophage sp.]